MPHRSSRGSTRSAQASCIRTWTTCDKLATGPSSLPTRHPIRVGTWNIRTLSTPGSARLLTNELSRAKINIMALQEVRWSDAGETTVAGYTFLWSGPPANQPRRAGVALAVDSNAYRALCSWQPISDRILVANFKHSFGKLSIVAVYAPTEEASDHEKDAFYTRLDQAMALTHRNNLILCLGDFNAVSGSDRSVNSTVVGPFGAGIPNDNSERLLDFCIGNNLRINGSWFRRDDIHRHSWYSNDGRTTKEIDHVLSNTRFKAVQQCRVYRSMEFNTDHRAVVATIAIKLKKNLPRTPTSPRYNIRKLQDPAFQQGFAVEVSNRFSALSEDEIGNWSIFKTELNSVATKTIGLHKPPKKEWLSPRTLETVEMKRTARLEGRLEDYKRLSAQCKDDILADKQKWADDLATEAELALNKGQVKDAFANLRRLRSACPRISSPISLVDGTLVSDKPQKLQRWKEYYSELLNRPSAPPSCELQEAAAQANPDVTIDCAPPSSAEVQRAIHRLKDGKAPACATSRRKCSRRPDQMA